MDLLHVQKLVNDLLLRSGSDVYVKLEDSFPGARMVGGKYSLATHTVTLYLDEIKKQCLHLFSTLDCLDEYLTVVFAHEVGHAEDAELDLLSYQLSKSTDELERTEIALRIEENAWENARTLTAGINQDLFNTIYHHSTQLYKTKLHHHTTALNGA
ncbi:hypothetical protein WQ57_07045 [Mesobacillus campisalis]|uniref:Uncharacterized protein n=1 Tax=Mesobacillus campisalis TaxID=1408103 RepID=A0A0M2T0G9_9BACI|nr:hypothetical protein [Mesobacillus campisalis]KKK38737.1 hypothetical protein WQ57_07045 [Mesobacillus campisalis]